MAKNRKKKSHRIYAFFVLTLGIMIIVLSMLLLFHIQKIEVKGNNYCTDKEIVDLAKNDRFSNNSLYVLGKYKMGKGSTLPCFEKITVGLKAPWSIQITVKEKQPVGYMMDGQNYVYFDEEGLVVEKGTIPIEGIPLVEGINVKTMEEYKPLKSDASGIFGEILKASQELKKQKLATEKIVCEKERIYLYVGNVCVSLGAHVTSEKIAQLPPILEKLQGQAGTLHLENYSEDQETIPFDVKVEEQKKSEEN